MNENTSMPDLFKISADLEDRARRIIDETDIVGIWKSIGATVNLIGSVKMGLMMKHRDMDFHIYSTPLELPESFAAMARLAANPSIQRIECLNLMDTEESCIEWHADYLDTENDLWQIDMIHILKGSRYDGYMERVSDRIMQILTPERKLAILRLKYDTPDAEKIPGINYYLAVIEGGVRTYEEFVRWRHENPVSGVVHWMP